MSQNCQNCRQLRVMHIPKKVFARILRGEARLTNMPGDADVMKADEMMNGALRLEIYSASYPPTPPNEGLLKVTPRVERTGAQA